jgi:hypothetical protein
LNLTYDKPLSKFAIKFNLRRYTMANSFTVILLCGSGYYFLFFKAQTEVYTMVPLDTDTEVVYFVLLLKIAAVCSGVGLAHTAGAYTRPHLSST